MPVCVCVGACVPVVLVIEQHALLQEVHVGLVRRQVGVVLLVAHQLALLRLLKGELKPKNQKVKKSGRPCVSSLKGFNFVHASVRISLGNSM